ncbi:diaminopimelate epimerase [Paraclostridium benzoelyticum]
MNFWKLHGVGNDFIAIDGRFDNKDSNDYSDLAEKVCHRRFGVGADGLLVVKTSDISDVEMVYYNSDGSRANMCGNGLRCFCKFVYDNNIVKDTEFSVYTLDGIKKISLNIESENNYTIRVNMGKPNFNPKTFQ